MADVPNEISVVIRAKATGFDRAVSESTAKLEALRAEAGKVASLQLGGSAGFGAAIEQHRAQIRSLGGDLKQFEKAQKEWGSATADAWKDAKREIVSAVGAERDAIRALGQMRTAAEREAAKVPKSAPGLIAAQRSLAKQTALPSGVLGMGNASVRVGIQRAAAQAEARIAAEAEKAAADAGALSVLNFGQIMRHMVAIFDGAMRGQRGQMIASTNALVRDGNVAEAAVKAIGTAGLGIGAGIAAGVAVAVAQLAILATSALKTKIAVANVAGVAFMQGRNPAESEAELGRLQQIMGGAGIFGPRKIAGISETLENIPGLSDKAREALAGVAEAITRVGYAGDLKEFEKKFPKALENPAAGAKAFGVAATDSSETLAAQIAAKFAPAAAALSDIRQRRFANPPEGGIIPHPENIVTDLYNLAVTPFAPDIRRALAEAGGKTLPKPEGAGAPLLLPGPQDTLAQALAQKAKDAGAAIKSGAASVIGSPAFDSGLPLLGYAGGGIVDSDQVAKLHAREMVLPPDISGKLMAFLSQSGGGGGAGISFSIMPPQTGAALAAAATKLSAAASRQVTAATSTDAVSATLSSAGAALKRASEEAFFSGHRRNLGGRLGADVLRSGAQSLYSGLYDSVAKSLFGSSNIGGGISNLLFGKAGLGGLLFGSGGLSGLLGIGAGGLLGGLLGGGGAGGLFGTLFKGIGSIFGFEHGGIVPSAAGGWAVPQLGPGGTLAQLHSNEMVLPANISQGLQGMIGANGTGGGGSTPTVNANFSVSALDNASVAKFFNSNGGMIVAAINRAMRNGAMLRTA